MAHGWHDIDWTTTFTVLAAWVQAVGSVAAIVAATWIARQTALRELRARHEAQMAVLAAASRLVSLYRVKVDALMKGLDEEDREGIRWSTPLRRPFEVLLSSMQAFPLGELSRPDAVVAYSDALQAADLVIELIRNVESINRSGSSRTASVIAFAKEQLRPMQEDFEGADAVLRAIAGFTHAQAPEAPASPG